MLEIDNSSKQRICSLDVINEHGFRDYNLEKLWKTSHRQNKLTCEECGLPVILKAGSEKTPHFAHKSGLNERECYYTHIEHETEEHRRAKLEIRNWIKNQFPAADVQLGKKLTNGRRPDVLVILNGRQLIIEYVRDINLEWTNKNKDYKNLGIPAIWLLSNGLIDNFLNRGIFGYNTNEVKFGLETVARETDDILRFLDVWTGTVTFMKAIRELDDKNQVKNQRYFSKEYPLDILKVKSGTVNGQDFMTLYETEKNECLSNWAREEAERKEAEKRETERKAELERLRKKPLRYDYHPIRSGVSSSNRYSVSADRPAISHDLLQKNEPQKPLNDWVSVANKGGLEKCIEILNQCKESPKLRNLSKLERENQELVIKACDKLIMDYGVKLLEQCDILGRLIIRVGNLANRLLE